MNLAYNVHIAAAIALLALGCATAGSNQIPNNETASTSNSFQDSRVFVSEAGSLDFVIANSNTVMVFHLLSEDPRNAAIGKREISTVVSNCPFKKADKVSRDLVTGNFSKNATGSGSVPIKIVNVMKDTGTKLLVKVTFISCNFGYSAKDEMITTDVESKFNGAVSEYFSQFNMKDVDLEGYLKGRRTVPNFVKNVRIEKELANKFFKDGWSPFIRHRLYFHKKTSGEELSGYRKEDGTSWVETRY
jgi:hypothetical protein